MRKRLTEISVEKIGPKKGSRLEVFDTVTRGLILRVTEKGTKSWSLLYRVAGVTADGGRGGLKRMSFGKYPLISVKQARELAGEALDLADRGIDPGEERKEEIRLRNERSFEKVVDRFVENHAKPNTVNWRNTDRLLREHLVTVWGEKMIDDIDRASAHTVLDKIIKVHGIGQAREVRKHMTKLFSWSVDRGLLSESPVIGMRRKELGYVPRERVLEMSELRSIWDATEVVGYPLGHLVRMLILTGQRRAEIATMRRALVLDDKAAFEIPASSYKTKRAQVVPLSMPALSLVEGLPRWNGGDFLFSTTGGAKPVSGFSKAKQRIDRESGVAEWTLHDIRRSTATHMARLGVMQEHIERVLGHRIVGVAGTYNQYDYLEEKRAALDLWGQEWS